MNCLGQRNLMGVVMDVNEGNYSIGTRDWMLNSEYPRNQSQLCSQKFIRPSTVPSLSLFQTTAMRNAFLGGFVDASIAKPIDVHARNLPLVNYYSLVNLLLLLLILAFS